MAGDHRRPFFMDPIRQFFSYSRSERNGILVLLVLIAVVLAVKTYLFFDTVTEPVQYDPHFEREIARFESDTLIELNKATKMELMNLPGVGPAFADRILEYKEALGGFVMKEQLLGVRGVGPAKFTNMEPFIRVDSALVRAIDLEHIDTAILYAHPYMDSIEVQSILSVKNKYQLVVELSRSKEGNDSLLYRYFTP